MKIVKIFTTTFLSAFVLLLMQLNTNAQIQKGIDIDGYGRSGYSISMPDSNTIAIGGPYEPVSNWIGYVAIYAWDGNVWVQKGANIIGEGSFDRSGSAVSMPDA